MKKFLLFFKKRAVNFLLLLLFVFSQYDTLGQIYVNSFTGTGACPTQGNTPTTAVNSTGTAVSRSTVTCTSAANVFNSNTLNNTASLSATSYIEFSATANAGYKLNLTSLSFFRQASGTAPNQIEVRYSTDGFATFTTWGAAPTTPTTGTVATWDFADFFTSTAGTVSFRIYPYGIQRADLAATPAAASTGTFRVDDVTINGTVSAVPTITLNTIGFSNSFSTTQNTPSSTQQYSVSGSGLTAGILITAPTGYEISKTGTNPTDFANTQTLTQSGGNASGTIYVRLTGASASPPSSPGGNITHESAGAVTQNIAVTGTVFPQPVITLSTNSLSSFLTTQGTPSAEQSYTVEGTFLQTNNITITPPSGVELSLSSGTGFSTNAISLTPSSGSVPTTTIYARLKGTAAGSVSGNIAHTATGATTQNVAITGAVSIINVSPSSLSGFTTIVGTASAEQTYSVDGINLSNDILITAPTDYEISTSSGSGFGSNLTLIKDGAGTVASTTIYVRLKGTAEGTYNSKIITHVSLPNDTKNVTLNGVVGANTTPTISVTPTSLSGFSTTQGIASATQTYAVSAVNLTDDLVITAPSGVEIKLSTDINFGSSINLTPSSGTVASTTIVVRLTGATATTISDIITHSATGATTQNVAISGTVVPPPAINVSTNSLLAFSTFVGTPSSTQNYTVSGSYLTADISLTAPTGFEISTSSNSGFGSSLTLTQLGGSVTSTTIYVRLTGASVGTPSGDITHASSGAIARNVAVSGTVNALPTITIGGTPLANFVTIVGTPSLPQQYTVSGVDLTNDIVINAPTGYEIKTGAGAYSASLTLTQISGSVATTTIDVRLTGASTGTFLGNVANTSTNTVTKNVAVTGNVVEVPTKINIVRSTIPAQASYTGTPVSVRGQVTAIFGANKFYVSDATGGIAIFTTNIVTANNIVFGDSVQVKGTTARFNGEAELSPVTSVVKLTKGTDPTPKIFNANSPPSGVALNDFLIANEGDFVQVISTNINATGTFGASSNYSYETCNNQGGSEIRIDATATVFNGVTIPSTTQDLTGVVGHFITSNAGTDKLQLYLRLLTDLSTSTISCPATGGGSGCGVSSVSDNPTTLDVMIWNLEWFGSPTNGPTQSGTKDVTQINNAKTVLNSVGADVYILEEICGYNNANPLDVTTPFGKLVAGLNTAFGANTYTGECSPDTSRSQPDNFAQHVCIIYKNSVVTKISSLPMFHNFTPATYPPTGSPSNFWSSGRNPFVFKAQVTLNGKVDTINFVGLHSKSGSDVTSYNRRTYDVKAMYDTLQAYYPKQKVLIGGDINDDVDVSIYANAISSYSPFLYANPAETDVNGVRPNPDFVAVTKILSDAHCASTYSFPDDIDHFILSNELKTGSQKFNYVDGSATNFKPLSIISNYSTTTSDHFPILIRLRSQPCPGKPTISPSSVSICTGSSTILTASACIGGTLSWTGGLTGTSITVSPTVNKDYKVACTIVDCTSDSSDVVTVTVNPIPTKPTITPSSATICSGETVRLRATACVDGTLNWTDGLTGRFVTVNPTVTKQYSVACTTNSCTSDSSNAITITVNPIPTKPIITPTSATICSGSSTMLTASVCADGRLGWTNNLVGTSITVSPTVNISYKVSCTILECTSDSSDAATVTVNPIPTQPTITPNSALICGSGSVSLTASACDGGTLSWTDNLVGTSISVSPTASKSYKVACTILSCTSDSSDAVLITVNPIPAKPTITPNSVLTCGGGAITLISSACTGGTLNWTDGLTGVSITVSPTATKQYRVACTINGCTSDSSSAATITVNPKPAKPVVSPSSPSICAGSGSSVTLTSTACTGGILNWTDALYGTSITVTPTESKSYRVACMIMGCLSDSSDVVTVVVNPIPSPPTLNATPSTITLGNSSTLTATGCTDGTITWSFGGATGTSLVVSPTSNTSYTATCTQNACVSPASASVTVTVNSTEPCQNLLNLVSAADDYASGVQLKQASSNGGKITATNKITATAITTYQAQSIELSPGFKADSGTVFKAEIGGCN